MRLHQICYKHMQALVAEIVCGGDAGVEAVEVRYYTFFYFENSCCRKELFCSLAHMQLYKSCFHTIMVDKNSAHNILGAATPFSMDWQSAPKSIRDHGWSWRRG